MVVEESRILQVSIFNTLQNNLQTVDFSKVLLDVMTIADEVDSQLKQQMLGYMELRLPSPQDLPHILATSAHPAACVECITFTISAAWPFGQPAAMRPIRKTAKQY